MRTAEINDGPGKTMSKLQYTLGIVSLLLFAGCQAERQFEAKDRICREDITTPEAMRLAEDVLDEMYFVIEKADVEHGLIKTRPLPGAQSFEVWRSENIGRYNKDMANLHSIVRTVQLTVSRDDHQLCVNCNVEMYRLSLPEREINSSARVYQLFFDNATSLKKLNLSGKLSEQMAWLEMGRDKMLETEILNRIETKITNLKR